MTIEHHKFAKDFPQLKQYIHQLKITDNEFAALMKEYDELDDQIYRIEEGIETPSDAYTEELKLKRVGLKDKLFAMIKHFSDSQQ